MKTTRLRTLAGSVRAVLRWPRWSREEERAFQSRRLRLMVRHAYEQVHFYRGRLDAAGVRPEEIGGLEDLARLPVVTRAELQATAIEERLARGADLGRLLVSRTSGATGRPMTVAHTRFEHRFRALVVLGAMRRYGLRLTDLQVGLYHRRPGKRWPVPFTARLGLLRMAGVTALASPQEILAQLRALAPDALGGYTGTLAWLTRFMSDDDRRAIRPRLLTCGAEVLTPTHRRQLTEAYGVAPFDLYQCLELGLIAWQCPHGELLHVCGGGAVIEVLRDGMPAAPGERGELVGTTLHAFAMPFLRYQLGDIVTAGPSPCTCGADVATLAAVEGRIADRFLLPDGREAHPFEFAYPLNRAAPWLARFQIVQTAPGAFTVRIEPLPGVVPPASDVEALTALLDERVGAGVRVAIEVVDVIQPDESGKHRPYIPFRSR